MTVTMSELRRAEFPLCIARQFVSHFLSSRILLVLQLGTQFKHKFEISGVRIKGYIRGCMSDVLISGFNQTIVTWYRWMHRDSCRPYRLVFFRILIGFPSSFWCQGFVFFHQYLAFAWKTSKQKLTTEKLEREDKYVQIQKLQFEPKNGN